MSELTLPLIAALMLLMFGMWVPFVVAAAGIACLLVTQGTMGLRAIGFVTWGAINSYTLTAIPLYILMAEFLLSSGLASRLYRGLNRLTRNLPGGLLQTNVLGCAAFSAISGSSVTTAAALGTVALPEMKVRNYPMSLAYGSLAAGGTLGILIPPSIAMIIYGAFSEASIVKLFMAGVLPGLLLTLLFMIYVAVALWASGAVVDKAAKSDDTYGAGAMLADLLPAAGLIGLVLGSLYLGWATPTEAAAIGCSLSLIFGLVWGDLNLRKIMEGLETAVSLSTTILFIVVTAFLLSYAMAIAGIGAKLTEFISSLDLSKTGFLLLLIGIFAVLGMFIESIAMIVITVPLLIPLLSHFGIDPIWFGVFVVILVELGQITPPFGINLFVLQSIGKSPFGEVVRGAVPYYFILAFFCGLLMLFPQIALWLPSTL